MPLSLLKRHVHFYTLVLASAAINVWLSGVTQAPGGAEAAAREALALPGWKWALVAVVLCALSWAWAQRGTDIWYAKSMRALTSVAVASSLAWGWAALAGLPTWPVGAGLLALLLGGLLAVVWRYRKGCTQLTCS